MKISENGINLIIRFEGLRTSAYKCPAGIWTIGYGHTSGVRKGDKCTEAQAKEFLKNDIEVFEACINNLVKQTLTQNQFDALVSFVFNIGCIGFKASTMLKYLNNKQYELAAEEFPKWVLSNGKKLEGLVRRRQAEQDLFLK